MSGVRIPASAFGAFGIGKKVAQVPAATDQDDSQPTNAEPVSTTVTSSGDATTVVGDSTEPTVPITEDPPAPSASSGAPAGSATQQAIGTGGQDSVLAEFFKGQKDFEEKQAALKAKREARKAFTRERGAIEAPETGTYEGPMIGPFGIPTEGAGPRSEERTYTVGAEREEGTGPGVLFLPKGKSREDMMRGLERIDQKRAAPMARMGELDNQINTTKKITELIGSVLDLYGNVGQYSAEGARRAGGADRGVLVGDYRSPGISGSGITPRQPTSPAQRDLIARYGKKLEDGRVVLDRDGLKNLVSIHNKLNKEVSDRLAEREIIAARRDQLDNAYNNYREMMERAGMDGVAVADNE